MGRTAVLIARTRAAIALVALVAALSASPFARAEPALDRFDVRLVAALGDPADPAVRTHLEHAATLGFNAVWLSAGHAGHWSAAAAPDGPFLDPAFGEFVTWCRDRGLRVFVMLSPVGMTAGTHRFTDRDARRRLVRFVRLLRRAGVRDLALAFDDQPTTLSELNDVLRFGRSAATAHLDLARRLARVGLGRGSFWLIPAADCDAHLGDGTGPYSAALLAGLADLPDRVGLVWTGPEVISASITRADLAATRARLGGRRLLVFDNYPNNGDFRRIGTGLVLGPLRRRGNDLHLEADAYLSIPTWQLGAARLPLATVADWLAGPRDYDPDASWERAIERLAGDDARAAAALRVQATEWGGWVGELNYHPAWVDNVVRAGERLDEPAWVASWKWTRRRYPERMRDLEGLADPVFRDDLLRVMERGLWIARAIPPAVEFRARAAAGRSDLGEALAPILAIRSDPALGPDAARALDLFLAAADIPIEGPPPAIPPQPGADAPSAEDTP